jgi:hypothetical protein
MAGLNQESSSPKQTLHSTMQENTADGQTSVIIKEEVYRWFKVNNESIYSILVL